MDDRSSEDIHPAMRALVTAGGTSEPIDDVRFVTNFSSGRFGAAIATALAERGVEVALLAGRALASHPERIDPRVRVVAFGSFADLEAALAAELATPPDLLFMAAAVSDFSPVRVAGKIRSDQDELVVRMTRNPKLLARLRERCGVGTFLVGFKLLSGASDDELVRVARRQVRENRLNLCVANDLQRLGGADHPVVLVTPEGGVLRHTGGKPEVARALVEFVLRRQRVRWHRSLAEGAAPPPDAGHAGATALLRFAIHAHLLPGTDGNVSHRAQGGLWTTPRQVAKALLQPEELVRCAVGEGTVRWKGGRKPSIDTAVHAWLYERIGGIAGLLHFHEGIVLPTATTSFPWPCGTVEEAEEIGAALLSAASDGRWDGRGFAVRLVDHGWLVGVPDGAALVARWDQVREGYRAHLRDIGLDPDLALCTPVLDGAEPIGVAARFDAEGTPAWSVWLTPDARGRGRGDLALEALAELRRHAIVADQCAVVDAYAERGWKVVARRGPFPTTPSEGGVALLIPPTLRDDLVDAASICLLDPVRRRVLIALRRTPPWEGYWAFPGGRREPGEDLFATALRELAEETGLRPAFARAVRHREVPVGGERGYRVHNFVVPVLDPQEPVPGPEVEARWVDLDAVAALRPMAAGTRRVLRGLGRLRW